MFLFLSSFLTSLSYHFLIPSQVSLSFFLSSLFALSQLFLLLPSITSFSSLYPLFLPSLTLFFCLLSLFFIFPLSHYCLFFLLLIISKVKGIFFSLLHSTPLHLPPLRFFKVSGIEVVTPEATNILVWFGSLYVFISPWLYCRAHFRNSWGTSLRILKYHRTQGYVKRKMI